MGGAGSAAEKGWKEASEAKYLAAKVLLDDMVKGWQRQEDTGADSGGNGASALQAAIGGGTAGLASGSPSVGAGWTARDVGPGAGGPIGASVEDVKAADHDGGGQEVSWVRWSLSSAASKVWFCFIV